MSSQTWSGSSQSLSTFSPVCFYPTPQHFLIRKLFLFLLCHSSFPFKGLCYNAQRKSHLHLIKTHSHYVATFSFHKMLFWGHLIQLNLYWTVSMSKTQEYKDEPGGLCLPVYCLLMEKDTDIIVIYSVTQHTFIIARSHSVKIYWAPTLGQTQCWFWVYPAGLLETRTEVQEVYHQGGNFRKHWEGSGKDNAANKRCLRKWVMTLAPRA